MNDDEHAVSDILYQYIDASCYSCDHAAPTTIEKCEECDPRHIGWKMCRYDCDNLAKKIIAILP